MQALLWNSWMFARLINVGSLWFGCVWTVFDMQQGFTTDIRYQTNNGKLKVATSADLLGSMRSRFEGGRMETTTCLRLLPCCAQVRRGMSHHYCCTPAPRAQSRRPACAWETYGSVRDHMVCAKGWNDSQAATSLTDQSLSAIWN